MRAYNRGNQSSSYQRRSSWNYHQGGRRYSNRREIQDTFSDSNNTHFYYESSSDQQPDFSQPPPSIDISKSTLSVDAPVFVPRRQITTDQNFSFQPTYVIICPNTGQILNPFPLPHPSTTLLRHESHEQFSTYVDESHSTEPNISEISLHDETSEENVHSVTEEKQPPHKLNENVEENGIEEVKEECPEKVNCEQKTETDTNVRKKELWYANSGNGEQNQRPSYGKNTNYRRSRNFHNSETHENDTKKDDRKNNNYSKDGKRNTDTQSFVRQHPTRNSRGESGSFRRNQRNDGKPSQTEKQRESKSLNDQKSVHFQLPQPEITVPQTPTSLSFSQVLQLGKSIESSVPTTVVDSVSHTPQNSEVTENLDTVDSACPDTNSIEVEQDNSKAWKKENIRPSPRPSTASKLNFVEMPLGDDLFSAPEAFSLAHCVGADFRMGMGIATIFKRKFQRVDELKKSKTKIGGVASLQDGNRFIFYLVTKEKSNIDPYFDDLQSSLLALRDECLRLGIRKLAIPRLGCGLDKLQWEEVRDEIKKIFADIEMEIRVYFIPYSKSEPATS